MINVYLCAQRRLHLNPSYEGKRSRDSLLSPSPNFGHLPYGTTVSCCMLLWRLGFPSSSLDNWISLEIHILKPFSGNKLTKVSRVFISGFNPLHGTPINKGIAVVLALTEVSWWSTSRSQSLSNHQPTFKESDTVSFKKKNCKVRIAIVISFISLRNTARSTFVNLAPMRGNYSRFFRMWISELKILTQAHYALWRTKLVLWGSLLF